MEISKHDNAGVLKRDIVNMLCTFTEYSILVLMQLRDCFLDKLK